MKVRNIVSLLVLIYAAKSIAGDCYILAWDKNYIISRESITSSSLIKETNCNNKIQVQFVKSLLDFEGSIQSNYLLDDLPNVDISPKKIVINSLSNLISERFSFGSNYKLDDLKASTIKVITLEQYDSISIRLKNKDLGKKSIAISINNSLKAQNKKIWVTGTLKARVKALVAKTHLTTTYGGIDPSEFEKRLVYSAYPERLFRNLARISHYRLNGPLSKGQALKLSNATALALVRSGTPVRISLEKNGIQLSGKAIPMRMGKYGDIIQLRSIKSKKTLTGKVIDFNKVVIQL